MSKKSTTPVATKAPRTGPKLPIEEAVARLADKLEEAAEESGDEDQGKGKIWHILKLFTMGYEKKDIARYGKETNSWSPVTVYRQAGEYEKLRKAPATHFQSFEIFEMRVKRIMAAKKFNREAAVEYIYSKDLEIEEKVAKATEAYKAAE